MGAPRYLISMICSVAVLAATNSEPYVAVSTVACFLEYQSTGVLLTKWRHPVKDLPVAKQWFKLASGCCGDYCLTKCVWHVIRKDFLNITIYRVCPIKILIR